MNKHKVVSYIKYTNLRGFPQANVQLNNKKLLFFLKRFLQHPMRSTTTHTHKIPASCLREEVQLYTTAPVPWGNVSSCRVSRCYFVRVVGCRVILYGCYFVRVGWISIIYKKHSQEHAEEHDIDNSRHWLPVKSISHKTCLNHYLSLEV